MVGALSAFLGLSAGMSLASKSRSEHLLLDKSRLRDFEWEKRKGVISKGGWTAEELLLRPVGLELLQPIAIYLSMACWLL
jgi:hypothetical protein